MTLFWVPATLTASISLPSVMLWCARTHSSTDIQQIHVTKVHKQVRDNNNKCIHNIISKGPKILRMLIEENLTASLHYSYRESQRGSEFSIYSPKKSTFSHLVVRRVDVSGVTLTQSSYIHTCAAQKCWISLLTHLLNSDVAMPTLASYLQTATCADKNKLGINKPSDHIPPGRARLWAGDEESVVWAASRSPSALPLCKPELAPPPQHTHTELSAIWQHMPNIYTLPCN